jgi:hypothetical protein
MSFIIHELEWQACNGSGAIAEVPVSHPGEVNSFVNTGRLTLLILGPLLTYDADVSPS